MIQESLQLLQKLTEDGSSRQRRLTDLLRNPEAEFTEGWYMCVPKCFNDALDISLTERASPSGASRVWTQGSLFSFSEGAVLYDTRKAYATWSAALRSLTLAVQVKQAFPVAPATEGNARSPGSVTFDILKPDEKKGKLVKTERCTMTQDEFVRFLIAGPETIA